MSGAVLGLEHSAVQLNFRTGLLLSWLPWGGLGVTARRPECAFRWLRLVLSLRGQRTHRGLIPTLKSFSIPGAVFSLHLRSAYVDAYGCRCACPSACYLRRRAGPRAPFVFL